jgi:hypothetical protein
MRVLDGREGDRLDAWHGDPPATATHRCCRPRAGAGPGAGDPLGQAEGEDRAFRAGRRPPREGALDPGIGDQPHPRRGRQDHDRHRPGDGAPAPGQEDGPLPARAFPGPGLRGEGRRHRRRQGLPGAGRRYQPALHGGYPRADDGPQPAVRDDRQRAALPGARRPERGARPPAYHLGPRDGHERPEPPQGDAGARRPQRRRPPGGSLRHHRCQRDHGHHRPRHGPRGPGKTPGPDHRRGVPRPEADHRR